MVERKVKVAIPCGIHIRPAGIISHTANGFKADSRIIFGYHVINCQRYSLWGYCQR